MKKLILFLVIAASLISCEKNQCAVCMRKVVGPDTNGNIKSDTLYKDKKFCGDQLKAEQAENGKAYEVRNGNITNRYVTLVYCH